MRLLLRVVNILFETYSKINLQKQYNTKMYNNIDRKREGYNEL